MLALWSGGLGYVGRGRGFCEGLEDVGLGFGEAGGGCCQAVSVDCCGMQCLLATFIVTELS